MTSVTKATPIAIETSVVFKCEVCKLETKDQEAYNMHSKENMSLNAYYNTRPCITGEFEFKTNLEWKEPMKKSDGPECTNCSKYFDKQDELEKHMAEKHGGKSQNKHTFNVFQESFEYTEEPSKHTQICHSIRCHLHDLSLKEKDDLAAHLQDEHGIKCALCDFRCRCRCQPIQRKNCSCSCLQCL